MLLWPPLPCSLQLWVYVSCRSPYYHFTGASEAGNRRKMHVFTLRRLHSQTSFLSRQISLRVSRAVRIKFHLGTRLPRVAAFTGPSGVKPHGSSQMLCSVTPASELLYTLFPPPVRLTPLCLASSFWSVQPSSRSTSMKTSKTPARCRSPSLGVSRHHGFGHTALQPLNYWSALQTWLST